MPAQSTQQIGPYKRDNSQQRTAENGMILSIARLVYMGFPWYPETSKANAS